MMRTSTRLWKSALTISALYFISAVWAYLATTLLSRGPGGETIHQIDQWIVGDATFIALLFTVFYYWPAMSDVLYPYYKKGDCEQAGFFPLRILLEKIPYNRSVATTQFILPLFATSYLFLVMVFDYLAHPQGILPATYYYGIPIIWVVSMLATGKLLLLVLIVGIPFGIGYLVSSSLYGGYLGATLILALLFAYSVDSNFRINYVTQKLQYESGMSLEGSPTTGLRKVVFRLRSLRWIIMLCMVVFTLFSFLENSTFSLQDLVLRYTPDQAVGISGTIVMLLVFSNISLRVFGGIFDYLQLDMFTMLSKIIIKKKEKPHEFIELDAMADRPIENGVEAPRKSLLPIATTNRIYELRQTEDFHFKMALYYFSLDVLLTSATVLRISVLPGLNFNQIETLSTILKIPVMIFLSLRILNAFQAFLPARFRLVPHSETFDEEMRSEKRYFSDLMNLLREIQDQRINGKPYIDLSDNLYLLGLSESEKLFKKSIPGVSSQ